MNVVCCSRDWRFKGKYEVDLDISGHFGREKQLLYRGIDTAIPELSLNTLHSRRFECTHHKNKHKNKTCSDNDSKRPEKIGVVCILFTIHCD